MSEENYYKILGVAEDASQDDIKRAYRRLSLKHHPDKCKDPESLSIFQQINHAYETIGDPQQREQYDMQRKFGGMGGMGMGMGMGMGGGVNHDQMFQDIFGSIFGGGGGMGGIRMSTGGPGVQGGGPIFMHVPAGAAGGGAGPAGIPQFFAHFARQMAMPVPIVKHITIPFGQIFTDSTMPIEVERWISQDGENRTIEKEVLYITIPKGIDSGEILVVEGKGNVLQGNQSAVKVIVQVDKSPDFERQGLNIIYNKQLTLKEALCGFEFVVPCCAESGGPKMIRNRGNKLVVQPNHEQRIPKLGVPRGDMVGDLIVRFHVVFPERLSDDVISKLSELLP